MPLTLDALMHPGMRWKNAVPLLHDGMAATLILGIGFAPITALALSLMGIFTLPFASFLLVIPALGVAMGLSCYQPCYGRLMLHGFVMGIIAVTCYDGVRILFIVAGWMDDFIPKIGGMLVGDGNHHAVLGYLWRYLGNGGGMGMAFVCAFALLKQLLTEHQQARITPRVTKHIALGFGCFVWACLIVTLKISPQGEDMMFAITPTSLLLSWIGHLVFGYTLGCLVNRFRPEVLKDSRQHFTEACQQTSEVDFRRLVEVDRGGGGVEWCVELAENLADADVRVLQVGRGVALQGKHAVPREHIIG